VIGHFHYVVAPGTIFALFAGIYFWFPKVTGRFMSEYWGKVHFWGSLLFMNLVFAPMFIQGLAGMLRRMSDGAVQYSELKVQGAQGVLSSTILGLNNFILWAAVGLLIAQVPFIINFFYSIKNGKQVENDNPWEATTLEWQAPTPPPHGNFLKPPQVYRGPHEYSVPGYDKDYVPQNQPPG
jgi:cytochrome c oxidase subunit 1